MHPCLPPPRAISGTSCHPARRIARLRAVAFALCALPALALAQPQLPPPERTDPVALGTMQGFPPPADKSVRLATVLKYPNGRWAYHHMRELGPTAAVWRGEGPPHAFPRAARELDAIAFPGADGKPLSIAEWQKNTYTDGLLVLHRGRVVYEATYAGMQPWHTHALWSMSKSLTGLLATQLIVEGVLRPEALVSSYLPELKDSAWGDASLQQALDMTTGVAFSENFADPASGIFQYLVAGGLLPPPPGQAGAQGVLAWLPSVRKAGEHGAGFHYKTVDTEVVGWVLQRATGKSLATLLSERVWRRIGAQEDGYVWTDPAGGQLASVGVGATLGDLGRLGEALRTGRIGGREVFAPQVLAEIRNGADPVKFQATGTPARAGYSYHNHWWIPHDADGSFEAKGLNGQHLHVNPAAELVIVKLSSHPVPNTLFTHAQDRAAFAAIAAALRGR